MSGDSEPPMGLREAAEGFMEYLDETLGNGNCDICGSANGETHIEGTWCDQLKRALDNVAATQEVVTTAIRKGELVHAYNAGYLDAVNASRRIGVEVCRDIGLYIRKRTQRSMDAGRRNWGRQFDRWMQHVAYNFITRMHLAPKPEPDLYE